MEPYLRKRSTIYLTAGGLCHINPAGGGARNAYGNAFENNGHSFAAIESLDSDRDGYTNLQEINAGTWPGDATSYPGPADATPPTVTAFTIPSSSSTLAITVNLLAATDNVSWTARFLALQEKFC